jgi:CRISPR-associated protein Cmr3
MQTNITPFDTLFVRDGKPFSMGEEVWASGIFPPPPSVIYGALRTAYFSQNLDRLEEAGGPGDPTTSLRIKRIFLHDQKENEFFIPCPYDIVESKAAKYSTYKEKPKSLLSLHSFKKISSYGAEFILAAQTDHTPVSSLGGNHWISLTELNAYLRNGEIPTPFSTDRFFSTEPKIGIQKSKATGSSADGMLYRVGLTRPENGISIFVEWEDTSNQLVIPQTGLLKLGGEGKATHYQPSNIEEKVLLPTLEGDIFKLVLATPAVFNNGWLPEGIDPQTRKGIWQGHQVEILAAVFDRAQSLGGFSMKTKHQKGGPKPMRKALPAGTVFYVKTTDQAQEVAKSFHNGCISEGNLSHEGFGLAYVGKPTND